MFSITFKAVWDAQDHMDTMSRRLNRQTDQVQDVINGIGAMSGYETVAAVLKQQKEKMSEEVRSLKEMNRALAQIQAAYGESERRSLAYEENIHVYRKEKEERYG